VDRSLRHVVKGGLHWYILFNEGQNNIDFVLETAARGARFLLDAESQSQRSVAEDAKTTLRRHKIIVLAVCPPTLSV